MVAERVDALENAVTSMRDQLNGFVNQLTGIFKRIDENDAEVKDIINDRIQKIESGFQGMLTTRMGKKSTNTRATIS